MPDPILGAATALQLLANLSTGPSSAASGACSSAAWEASSPTPSERQRLVAGARAGRGFLVLAVRAPRADDPGEDRAPPGTRVVELAVAGLETDVPNIQASSARLRLFVNDDRAAVLAPGSAVRPRLQGGDGVQLFAGSTRLAFVPTPALDSGLGDGSRPRP